jgi:predicted nucleotidyltransferase component of viral defense system
VPTTPATDTKNSLDFDEIKITGETFPASSVQVEISYREGVVDEPVLACIGGPFYEPFEVLTMHENEMAAEKLRALAQRRRATDLADLAVLLNRPEANDQDIARLVATKFELVAFGRANREDRIEKNLQELADTYDNTVPGLFPDAPTYNEAIDIVWPRMRAIIP